MDGVTRPDIRDAGVILPDGVTLPEGVALPEGIGNEGVTRPFRDDATDGGLYGATDSFAVATNTPHFSGHVK